VREYCACPDRQLYGWLLKCANPRLALGYTWCLGKVWTLRMVLRVGWVPKLLAGAFCPPDLGMCRKLTGLPSGGGLMTIVDLRTSAFPHLNRAGLKALGHSEK